MASKSLKQSQGIKNLRKVRRIAGLTQEQLAKIIPVAYGTARDIENGNKPYSEELVQKIAKRLGCGYEKDEDSGAPGLTVTQINTGDPSGRAAGTDQEYTHDWFLRWNEMMLRKEMYRLIMSRHRRVLDEMLEVSCGLDAKHEIEDENAAPFSISDEVVGVMVENTKKLLENEVLREALEGELPKRDFVFEHFRTIQDDIEKSHKRYHLLKEKLGILKPRE